MSGGCLRQLAKEQWYLDEALWNNLIIVAGGLSIKDLAKRHRNAKEIHVHRLFYLRSLKKKQLNTALQEESSGTKQKQKKITKKPNSDYAYFTAELTNKALFHTFEEKPSLALLCASFWNSKIKLLSLHPSCSLPAAAWLYTVCDLPLCGHGLVPKDHHDLLTQQNRHLKNNTVHFRVVPLIAHWLSTPQISTEGVDVWKSLMYGRLVVTRWKGLLQPAESPGKEVLCLSCSVCGDTTSQHNAEQLALEKEFHSCTQTWSLQRTSVLWSILFPEEFCSKSLNPSSATRQKRSRRRKPLQDLIMLSLPWHIPNHHCPKLKPTIQGNFLRITSSSLWGLKLSFGYL